VTGRAKDLVYRLSAAYWRARSRGRIRGESFRIRRPERLIVTSTLTLGRGTVIDTGARLIVHAETTVGDDVYISRDCVLGAYGRTHIGDRVLMGERVSIHGGRHGPPGNRDVYSGAPVTVEDDVWLCAGCVLTPGVTVGARSTVGANAVVTNDVPEDVLAVGVPARAIDDPAAAAAERERIST
jgi:acetyltransferase-like isoleucine patch superfamily enzyme